MNTDPAFLFTDVEGSTRLWEEEPAQMAHALEIHDVLLREAILEHDGRVFSTAGDAFAAQFGSSAHALAAARDGQRRLAAAPWPADLRLRVRMGVHQGPAQRRGGDFFGPTLNKAARIMSAGHGGQILASALALPDPLPEGLRQVDQGVCRLKDIRDPEHLYQLSVEGLTDEFPPLRTARVVGRLPRRANTLIGRETELRDLQTALSESRLVTLMGPPGVGKTRLALEVAAQQANQHGTQAYWVDLTAIDDADGFERAMTQSILGDVDLDGLTAIERTVGDATALVVIDNCEHLLEECATAVSALMDACPGLFVLCTSRQPLATGGEFLFELGPLSVAASSISESEWSPAAELFAQRARQSNRAVAFDSGERALAVRLCEALDGLPLAVEVAAGMLWTMPLKALVADVNGLRRRVLENPQRGRRRHDTLRAALDWSVLGLSPDAEELLRRAALFPRGWDVAAAAAVCGEAYTEDRAWSAIQELFARSLIGAENRDLVGRYTMLQPIREYAGELTDQGFRDATYERLLGWANALVGEARAELTGPNQTLWMDRLETDHENILTALRWALRDGCLPGAALELAAGIWPYWARAWQSDSALELLERTLKAAPSGEPASIAAAWNGYATIRRVKGDLEAGRSAALEALRWAREAGDPSEEGQALYLDGLFLYYAQDYALATDRLLASMDAFRKARNDERAGSALSALGSVHYTQGDLGAARSSYQQALEMAEIAGVPGLRAVALVNLAEVDRDEGRFEAALESFTRTLSAFHALRDFFHVSHTLEQIGGVLSDLRDPLLGARALGAAAQLREETGYAVEPVNAGRLADDLDSIRQAVGREAADAAFDLGGERGLGAILRELSDHASSASR